MPKLNCPRVIFNVPVNSSLAWPSRFTQVSVDASGRFLPTSIAFRNVHSQQEFVVRIYPLGFEEGVRVKKFEVEMT